METSKATINIYDYGKHKNKKHKKKVKRIRTVVIPILSILLLVILFSVIKYSNKDKIKEIDKKISASLEIMRSTVKNKDFDEDFLLIVFPDNSKIISNNGYIINDIGASYKEFQAGYIIMYKNGTYEFELQDDGYCAVKNTNDDKYQLLIFKKCSSKQYDYLKK